VGLRSFTPAWIVLGLVAFAAPARAQINEQWSPSATMFNSAVHYLNKGAGGMCVNHYGGTTPVDSLPCLSLDGLRPGLGLTLVAETPGGGATPALHAFAITAAGNAVQAQYVTSGWGGWQSLSGQFTTKLGATYFQGKIWVFGRGTDGALWAASGVGDEFTDWNRISDRSFDSAPAVAASGDNIQIVVRSDKTLLRSTFNGSSASAWTKIADGVEGDPTLIWSHDDAFELSSRGTDHMVYGLTYRLNGVVTSWTRMGGVINASPALVRDAAGSASVFVLNSTNGYMIATRSLTSPWSGFRDVSTTFGGGSASGGTGYPAVSIKNYAPFGLQVWVHYTLNTCATKWTHVTAAVTDSAGNVTPGTILPQYSTGRNLCLINRITVEGDRGTPSTIQISPYFSTGTSYRQFLFLPEPPESEFGRTTKSWVLYSDNSAPSRPDQGTSGMSPGFAITNKTKWPVAVSLDQAGCLYYDVLQPNHSMNRTTGAVWFTITAKILPDGLPENDDLKCAIPIVQAVAAVIEAALTAGAFSFASLGAEAVQASVGPVLARVIPSSSVIQAAATAAGKAALSNAISQIAKDLTANQSTRLYGQYAGPPWPFRCDQKPLYEIRDGWGGTGLELIEGATMAGRTITSVVPWDQVKNVWIDAGAPIKIVKINTCGNDMMR
jgi:hypothetical protein